MKLHPRHGIRHEAHLKLINFICDQWHPLHLTEKEQIAILSQELTILTQRMVSRERYRNTENLPQRKSP